MIMTNQVQEPSFRACVSSCDSRLFIFYILFSVTMKGNIVV